MKKVKNCSVQWDGLDVHAWVEYQAELGESKNNLLIKDYDNLTESQRDILDSIISHINDCIAEFVSTNLDAIVKDLVKDKICSYAD